MGDDRIFGAMSFLIMLVVCGSWYCFPIFMPSLSEEFDQDRTSISTVISVGLVISGVALPFTGRLIDRFGPKKVILVFSGFLAVSLILKGTVTSLLDLLVFHGIMGALGYAGSALVGNTVLVSKLATKRMLLAMSLSQSGLPLGQQIFVPLATYLMVVYDWRFANIVLGLICLLLVPVFLFVMAKFEPEIRLDSTNRKSKQARSNILTRMRSTPYLHSAILYFCCGFTDVSIASHLTSFAHGIGVSEFVSANLFGMIGGFTWIGTIACGTLAGKLGRNNLLVGIYAVRSVSLILLLYAYNIPALLLFVILFGLTYFSMVPLVSTWLRDTYGPESLGGLLGTLSLVHAVGASSGTYIYGIMYDINGHYQQAFILALGVSLIATLCAILIRKSERLCNEVL